MSRVAAVVPAAGKSERMGRPKLILPVGGVALVVRVVDALRVGGADPIVVVAPPSQFDGAAELARVAGASGARILHLASPTPDMRASVEAGLSALEDEQGLTGFLLTPADSPGIPSSLVSHLLAAHRESPGRILIPVHGGRKGHPVLLPWCLVESIRSLPPDQGVNAAIAQRREWVTEIQTDDPAVLEDIDTPDDYRRWSRVD